MSEQKKNAPNLDEAGSAAPAPRRKHSRAVRRVVLFLILLLPFLTVTAYVAYQQRSLENRLERGLNSTNKADEEDENATTFSTNLAATLAEQENLIAEMGREIEVLKRQLDEAVDDSALLAATEYFEQEIQLLDRRLTSLQRQQTAPEPDWKLREAELLMGIAARRLQLEGNVSAAIALLKDADAALVASRSAAGSGNGGTVLEARQAIAADMAALQQAGQLDRDGIYLRLSRLLQDLEQMDLLDSLMDDFAGARPGGTTSESAAVTTAETASLGRPLDILASVFVWRKREPNARDALQSGLLPGQAALIRQRLRMLLEQARLSLYSRNNTLYQASLAELTAELQHHGLNETQAGQAVGIEIAQLATIDVDPPLPDLARSTALVARLAARN